jgi:hypothetical protein
VKKKEISANALFIQRKEIKIIKIHLNKEKNVRSGEKSFKGSFANIKNKK